MKSFKDMAALEKKLQTSIAWEDYFKLGGKLYTMYEYGPGPGVDLGYDYVYFLNKKTGDLIYIKYDCPSYRYVDGKRQQTKQYRFIDIEYIPQAYLWR